MVNKKLKKKLFKDMLSIRLLEEAIAAKYDKQEMRCPVHLSIGQEAVAVGVCVSLAKSDLVFGGHRSHAIYIAKGGNMYKLLSELYGKSDGASAGRGGSMHLVDLDVGFLGSSPIVASSIPVATGVAFAEKMKRTNKITAVFFGEAAIEEGVFHESLNFASLKKLPILYVCENNLYSVYTALSARQPRRNISQFVEGYGINSISGDGNDSIQVYNLAQQSIKQIRAGSGPVFLEFATYRWREHCGPNFDNHLGYRSETEFAFWQRKDPLKKIVRELIKTGVLSSGKISLIYKQTKEKIEQLFQLVKENKNDVTHLSERDAYA